MVTVIITVVDDLKEVFTLLILKSLSCEAGGMLNGQEHLLRL